MSKCVRSCLDDVALDLRTGADAGGPRRSPPSSLVESAGKDTGGAGSVTANQEKTMTVADLVKMVGAAREASSVEAEDAEKEELAEKAELAGLADDGNYSLPKIQGAVFEIREKLKIIRANLTSIHNFNAILRNNTINDASYLASTLSTIQSNTVTIAQTLDLYRYVHSDMAEEVVGDSMAAVSQCRDEWNCAYEDGDCGNEWDAVDNVIDLKCQYCVKRVMIR